MLRGSGRELVRTSKWKYLGIRAHAYTAKAPAPVRAANPSHKIVPVVIIYKELAPFDATYHDML